MQHDQTTQAILLLCTYFSSKEVRTTKPLTPVEYARFASWLHQNKLTPANLLTDQNEVLERWQDPKNKITTERLQSLLSRGASMAFALEGWAKQGIKVLTRANKDYPKKIHKKIGDHRPPVFFAIGNLELLNKSGIGFVGSRSIDTNDQEFTQHKAQLAAKQGYVIVSGGAKGADQAAMLAALEQGGESIGILAESLLKAAASKVFREGLQNNRLLLLSSFYPEAGFNTGNAMARNKYIYALSDAAIVVKSDHSKGGTWAGATENLKKNWTPIWVRNSEHQGNQELIKLGAHPMQDDFSDFNSAVTAPMSTVPTSEASTTRKSTENTKTGDLFGNTAPTSTTASTANEAPNATDEPPTEIKTKTAKAKKSVVSINPTDVFIQLAPNAYIETQAEMDACLNALKEQLQTAIDKQQRIQIR